jgi:hypothetical protein
VRNKPWMIVWCCDEADSRSSTTSSRTSLSRPYAMLSQPHWQCYHFC